MPKEALIDRLLDTAKHDREQDARRIERLEAVLREVWDIHDVAFTLSPIEIRDRLYETLCAVNIPSRAAFNAEHPED